MRVLRAQYAYARQRQGYKDAYRDGLRDIVCYYAEPVLLELSESLKTRDMRRAWPLFLTCLRWYPAGLLRIFRHDESLRKGGR